MQFNLNTYRIVLKEALVATLQQINLWIMQVWIELFVGLAILPAQKSKPEG